MKRVMARRGQRGQTLVESAIVLPMTVFVVLGMLQLFLLLQARMMAQYAAYKAVRAGSINKGDCVAMTQAAAATLLSTLAKTDTTLATAYVQHLGAGGIPRYVAGVDGFNSPLVQIVRETPQPADVRGNGPEDVEFDDWTQTNGTSYVLGIHMAYWYQMRMPFVNWVMGRIFLAHYNLTAPPPANPYQLTSSAAGWSQGTAAMNNAGLNLGSRMASLAAGGHYLFPIQVNAAMPMMTPPNRNILAAGCP